MMTKDILLLAVSNKGKNNYCVAGIDVKNNTFIRLVSDDPEIDNAIKKSDFVYTPYPRVPRKLHVIRVYVDRLLPKDGAQSENYLSLINKDVIHLGKVIEINDSLFPSISNLPYGGSSNVISEHDYCKLDHSIEVVKATNISFTESKNDRGERRVRINFYLNSQGPFGQCIDFRLTDPNYTYNPDILTITIEKAYLIITVGPKNNSGYQTRYKFVAGIIPY